FSRLLPFEIFRRLLQMKNELVRPAPAHLLMAQGAAGERLLPVLPGLLEAFRSVAARDDWKPQQRKTLLQTLQVTVQTVLKLTGSDLKKARLFFISSHCDS